MIFIGDYMARTDRPNDMRVNPTRGQLCDKLCGDPEQTSFEILSRKQSILALLFNFFNNLFSSFIPFFRIKHTKLMADNNNKAKHQDMSADLMRFLKVGDFTGAERFLCDIDEQDRKIMLANNKEINAMLFDAALKGNSAMVEFLVKVCQANIEEGGKFDIHLSATPLWPAASRDRLKVMKLLLELGANKNAVSNTELTTVNYAYSRRQIETVTFLVKQGADIKRPDEQGETCLMNSVQTWELCQLLVDNGAVVNAQDNFGNTALHHAIKNYSTLEIVQLLLDHGSDQNIKNNQGDDALHFASLHGRVCIVNELVARQKPTALRWIESLQLLGSHFVFFEVTANVEQALFYWRRSVLYRMKNPCVESSNSESMPACKIVQEVSTVEELEEISQDENMLHTYALKNLFRILGPSHRETTNGLFNVSLVFVKLKDYRRSLDLLKCAFQLLHECTPTWTKDFRLILTSFCTIVCTHLEFEIGFHDVVEIFDMVTSKAQLAFTMKLDTTKLYVMQQILSLVLFLVKLDKNPDQLVSFKQTIHRLVQSQIRDEVGRTFLHHAVERCDTYPGVAKVLLECGADVNSVDSRHNTAMHLSTGPYTNSDSSLQNEKSKVIELLLQYSAHPDIVNDHGDFAATGLSLNMLDHVNLKCLATAVIRDHQIPYLGQIPESLESFVKMHGRYPSKNFQIRSRQTKSEMFFEERHYTLSDVTALLKTFPNNGDNN